MQTTNTRSILLAGFGIFVLLGFSGSLNSQAPAGADISGTWVLNEAESDNPREQMRERRGDGEFEGRRPRQMRDGRGGMDRDAMRRRMEFLKSARERFTLQRGADAVVFIYSDGSVVEVPTTGEEVTLDWPGYGEIDVRAVWNEDGVLEVVRKFGRRPSTTTYLIDPETNRLIVTTKIEGRRGTREIRSVYDLEDEG